MKDWPPEYRAFFWGYVLGAGVTALSGLAFVL